MVIVKVPVEPEQERVEVWDEPRVMLVGFREHDMPVVGETERVRVTVPVNPLTGATVMVEAPPDGPTILVGFAVTVKSIIVTINVAEWTSPPLFPVTVTL